MNRILSLFTYAALLVGLTACGLTETDTFDNQRGGDAALVLGSIIAVTISWSRNGSVLWAVLHGILGWLYVIYYVLNRDTDKPTPSPPAGPPPPTEPERPH